MKHRVFVFTHGHPAHTIREVEADIILTPARAWALVGGNRRLLGSTAFYTRAAAERAKYGALVRMQQRSGAYYHRAMPAAYERMCRDIIEYRTTGTLTSTRTIH